MIARWRRYRALRKQWPTVIGLALWKAAKR
jgi:hypothetical protein